MKTPWQDLAACRGMHPGDFHPSPPSSRHRIDPTLIVKALEVCDGCEVRTECLNHAITHGERDGIWGGTTPNQRYKMIRSRCAHCRDPFANPDARYVYCADCRQLSRKTRRTQ